MSGTKIMVFQLKELIKTGVFVLIGLILIITLIIYLLPKNTNEAAKNSYLPGTYAAQIILHSKPVDVVVTVTDKEITNIELINMKNEQEVFYPLFKPTLAELSKQIIKYQTTKIATSTESAMTSKILLNAVNAALKQAEAQTAEAL